MVKYKTSYINGHNHYWDPKKNKTSVDAGHSHPVSKTMALKGNTNHTHRLTKSKY